MPRAQSPKTAVNDKAKGNEASMSKEALKGKSRQAEPANRCRSPTGSKAKAKDDKSVKESRNAKDVKDVKESKKAKVSKSIKNAKDAKAAKDEGKSRSPARKQQSESHATKRSGHSSGSPKDVKDVKASKKANMAKSIKKAEDAKAVQAVKKAKESKSIKKADGLPARKQNSDWQASKRSRQSSGSPKGNLFRRARSPTPKRNRCSPQSSSYNPVRLHIKGLEHSITRNDLINIFSDFGEVINVDLPLDRVHRQFCRGFAFVEFATAAECSNALKTMNGGQVNGKEIVVSPYLECMLRSNWQGLQREESPLRSPVRRMRRDRTDAGNGFGRRSRSCSHSGAYGRRSPSRSRTRSPFTARERQRQRERD